MIVSFDFDPENSRNIYLVEDDQNVSKIVDNGEGKGVKEASHSLAAFSIQADLKEILKRPWASVSVTERMVKLDELCLSMNSSLFWKTEELEDNTRLLVSERRLPGALYSL